MSNRYIRPQSDLNDYERNVGATGTSMCVAYISLQMLDTKALVDRAD